jgi:TRAP-type uncharacterized transport system fused permease subunit
MSQKLSEALCLILVLYSIPILKVYSLYSHNPTLSNILTNKQHQTTFSKHMMLMCILCIYYEWLRKSTLNLYIISILSLSIQGVILTNESDVTHDLCAYVSFAMILLFMLYNSILRKPNNRYLHILCLCQAALMICLIKKWSIFNAEIASLCIFAIFYLYLHTLE